MKKTANPFSLAEIGKRIKGKQRSEGKPVSKARVSFMLRNPSQGANRQRLMSALQEMGLTEIAAERFINQNAEK